MITVRPVRFTPHTIAMRDFLTALGLGVTISRGETWFDLRGAAGGMAVHPVEGAQTGASAGSTALSFEIDDAERVRERLGRRGRRAVVWDESYGRVLGVDAPGGSRLWLDAERDDLYGYAATGQGFGGDLVSCPVVFTTDSGPWLDLLADLGGEREVDSPGYAQVAFPGTGGCVGVHAPRAGDVGEAIAAGFLSISPLDRVHERLIAAGCPARLVPGPAPRIDVTDPSGATVEIHPR